MVRCVSLFFHLGYFFHERKDAWSSSTSCFFHEKNRNLIKFQSNLMVEVRSILVFLFMWKTTWEDQSIGTYVRLTSGAARPSGLRRSRSGRLGAVSVLLATFSVSSRLFSPTCITRIVLGRCFLWWSERTRSLDFAAVGWLMDGAWRWTSL